MTHANRIYNSPCSSRSCWQIDDPVPLQEADLYGHHGWVYDREVGVYVCNDYAEHEFFMGHLESLKSGVKYSAILSEDLAEEFIKREGTCFVSTMNNNVQVWDKYSLNTQEKTFLRRQGFAFSYIK